MTALWPIGPPVSWPGTRVDHQVNGCYSANQRIADGIEFASIKPLPRNARIMSGVGALLARFDDLGGQAEGDRQRRAFSRLDPADRC